MIQSAVHRIGGTYTPNAGVDSAIVDFDGFCHALGLRPMLAKNEPKLLAGPFPVYASLADNTASQKLDLTSGTAWSTLSKRFAMAYGTVVSGIDPAAFLQIESVGILFYDNTFRALAPSLKDDLLAGLYLETIVGGVTERIDLIEAQREAFARSIELPSTGTLIRGEITGVQFRLPEPRRLTLDVDTFTLNCDAAVNMGAACPICVVIGGAVAPKGYPGAIPTGGVCGIGGPAVGPMTYALFDSALQARSSPAVAIAARRF